MHFLVSYFQKGEQYKAQIYRIIERQDIDMDKESCYLKDFGYEKFERVVEMLDGKWKLRIIYMLAFHEVLRYGELKRLLAPITHKMLTNQLKELERDGLITRTEYPQIPPKVEYSMTEMGRSLQPVVKEMYLWISKYEI